MSAASETVKVTVKHCRDSGRKKCPRCWHWTHTHAVGSAYSRVKT